MTTLQPFLPWLAILGGFVGLIWSADRFVEGSASIASRFGVPKLIIGLTIVAFGTSAPEVLVSISSSLKGAGDLAVGNALGSNLANIGLVLAITCFIAPIPIKLHILQQEFLIMLGISAVAGLVLWDANLTTLDGMILMLMMIPLMLWIFKSRKNHPEEVETLETLSLQLGLLWFVLGLVALIISSEVLVWGARTTAINLGVSPLIVGLTIVAVGTSLPELAASIASALKGHHDIALGNVIGSNMFNLCLVMGIAPIIQRIDMGPEVFHRDFIAMAAMSLMLGLFMLTYYALRKKLGKAELSRVAGAALLLGYIGYYVVLLV